MNFDDTPAEAAFRAKVRVWIDANAPMELKADLESAGFGSLEMKGVDAMSVSKAWQKKKADAGWACLHWPTEYGGRGATPIERVIWGQEEGPFGALGGVFIIGHGMCGPTVMAFASEDQKRRYLPPLAAGEEIWCQLFSEPAGGSDLAGLRTRAEPAPNGSGDWIINGQKIWTSGAHYSDMAILVTRTDATVPKHKGLTMFFLSMKTPGIEIRPIKQANGQSGFNEVYFTDVRIPDAQRLGAVGDGWKVSLTTLMNERLSIGSGMSTGFPELFELCCRIETENGLAVDDPAVRSKLATWAVRTTGLKYTSLKPLWPLACLIGRMSMPGDFMSRKNMVMPLCLGRVGSVRVIRIAMSEYWAPLVQIFWPLMIQSPEPSGAFSALVRKPARSDPPAGSENS